MSDEVADLEQVGGAAKRKKNSNKTQAPFYRCFLGMC
jgi:hypothetical protein